MTTTSKTKITDPESNFTEIETSEESKFQALQAFSKDCERRMTDTDPATSIRAEIEAERAAQRIAEYESHPIADRALQLADKWVADSSDELVAYLTETLAERTKSKGSFLAGIGEKVSAFGLAMFATGADRDQLAADRERAEDEVAVLESAIAIAVQEIRSLAVAPSLQSYRRAAGAVSRVNIISISPSASSGR